MLFTLRGRIIVILDNQEVLINLRTLNTDFKNYKNYENYENFNLTFTFSKTFHLSKMALKFEKQKRCTKLFITQSCIVIISP